MAQYYAPMMGGQQAQLPTLTGQAGGSKRRRFPAPYGYSSGGIDDDPGSNLILPPAPPPTGVPPTTPPPTVPPVTTPAPIQPQMAGTALPNQQYSGGVYTPKPEWWVTEQGAYRPIQFPGVQSSGNGRATYEDGSYVDYGSGAWGKAQTYQPPAEYSELWTALPDSWKVDLAGKDPSFVAAYLAAVAGGNNAQAQNIYGQATDYQTQMAQFNQSGGGKPRPKPLEYRDSPYYTPSR